MRRVCVEGSGKKGEKKCVYNKIRNRKKCIPPSSPPSRTLDRKKKPSMGTYNLFKNCGGAEKEREKRKERRQKIRPFLCHSRKMK